MAEPARQHAREHRPRPEPTAERQSVRLLLLTLAVVALLAGAVLLAFGLLLGAGGFAVVGLLAGGAAMRMYAELHEEEKARIARGEAVRAVVDPLARGGAPRPAGQGPTDPLDF
jgi:hypothetical protein